MPGPLHGIRVIELAGIGPGPYAAMLLSDMGADVVRVDRAAAVRPDSATREPSQDVTGRGRRSIGIDLKSDAGRAVLLDLVRDADALIEGFRPGVTERLGIGPQDCAAVNTKLVYGRMTGWGQDGPYAQAAGHDINYIALAGALHPIGRGGENPVPPLNLVGDYGGGSMFLLFGLLCALLDAQRTGAGQVVDAAMVDGAASLTSMFHGMRAMGVWSDQRGENLLDTGAHFYDTYQCSDGQFISVGAIEPQFYAVLCQVTGFEAQVEDRAAQMDRASWPERKVALAELFRSKSREQWCALLEHTDACFAPVLSLAEAPAHPHLAARGTFTEAFGVVQPAPAPRLSRTPGSVAGPPAWPGQHTAELLSELGYDAAKREELSAAGVVA